MTSKAERSISEIVSLLEQRAPSSTAEVWDNVGLLIGDPSVKTQGVVISIDLTTEAIEKAVQSGYRLIINHHPCIFPRSKGLSRFTSGNLAFEAATQGIAVAAYHTNFDQCALEVIQSVSQSLGVEPKGRLFDQNQNLFLKLVVFVPPSHLEKVSTAVCQAGAGHIGEYENCTYRVLGEGTFQGSAFTRPFIGKPESLEKTEEVRFETIFPRGLKDQVLAALLGAHPYEEVAYDLYPVEQGPVGKGTHSGHGYGFWGEFSAPKPFSDVVKDVKNLFNIHGFWITRPFPSVISRIGFVAGKGTSFLDSAVAAKCDLFITGEAGYHSALAGMKRGMAVMEVGHRESEKFFTETVKKWVSGLGLEVEEIATPTQQIVSE